MRDNEWLELFYVESFIEGTEYIHLRNGVIITKDAFKISIFNTICEFRKNGDVYLELLNRNRWWGCRDSLCKLK